MRSNSVSVRIVGVTYQPFKTSKIRLHIEIYPLRKSWLEYLP